MYTYKQCAHIMYYYPWFEDLMNSGFITCNMTSYYVKIEKSSTMYIVKLLSVTSYSNTMMFYVEHIVIFYITTEVFRCDLE